MQPNRVPSKHELVPPGDPGSRDVFPHQFNPFVKLVLWPIAHPLMLLSLTFIGALLALISVSRLHTDASLASMFPAHDPSAEALIHVLDDFPAADQLIVLASLPDGTSGADPQRLIEFGHRFALAIHGSTEMAKLTDGVFYRPDSDSREFVEKVIGPSAMFYLDDATFDAARKRLTREEIERQIARDRAILAAPGPAADAMSKLMQVDPLRLHEFITDRLASQRPFHTYQNREEFVSPDGRSLLVRVLGKKPPSDLDYSHALTDAVTRIAQAANEDGLKLQFTGSYPIAARAEQSIRRDMIGSVIGSVILLQLLFLLVYRRPFMLFALAFGPVALGILFGFGIDALISTGLTPLTAVLGAILAGMGIDYSIQYISYYESRRTNGSGPAQAARETAANMSLAVLAAWATSVVGFVAIGYSSVKALRDFAILGTLGLTGAFVCAVVVLPAILMLTDQRPTPATRSRLRFGTGSLLAGLGRHRRIWLGLSILMMLFAVAIVFRSHGKVLPFESDLTVMHPRPNPALDAQYDVAKAFGVSPGSLIVYLRAPDSAHLVSLAYEVKNRLDRGQLHNAGVTGTYGLATLLPDPRTVPQRLSSISQSQADRVVAKFNEALDDNGFDPLRFAGYSTFLRTLLTTRTAPTVNQLVSYRRLAETVLPGSAFEGKPRVEAVTLVFVSGAIDQNRADRDRTIAAVRDALQGLDGATVTGMSVVAHDAEQTVRHELPRLILAAVLIVAAYLAVHFRNLADAALALLPAIFGILVAAAFLGMAGQKLNMVNLVSVPLLIGIDVDYGIFLVTLSRFKRMRQQDGQQLTSRIEPACHAVIVCATATILGYISLAWTSVPAEQSLGIAAAAGIGACLVGVLFLLVPLFFSLTRKCVQS